VISHLQHTNVSAISKELSDLLASNGSLSSSRVLTLVVLAEKGHSREAINAAIRASHEHPSRIIVHIAHNSDAPDQLDAEIHVGGEAGASELIILRGWGSASTPTESLISGLLLSGFPLVVWWARVPLSCNPFYPSVFSIRKKPRPMLGGSRLCVFWLFHSGSVGARW